MQAKTEIDLLVRLADEADENNIGKFHHLSHPSCENMIVIFSHNRFYLHIHFYSIN